MKLIYLLYVGAGLYLIQAGLLHWFTNATTLGVLCGRLAEIYLGFCLEMYGGVKLFFERSAKQRWNSSPPASQSGLSTSSDSEQPPRLHYLDGAEEERSWLLTRDHKRIALLYLVGILSMFYEGAQLTVQILQELRTPEANVFSLDTYYRLLSMHGIILTYFVLIPVIPAVLGNFLLPMMIGAKNLAFPRLNLVSFHFYVAGCAVVKLVLDQGGIDSGWTIYRGHRKIPDLLFDLTILAVFLVALFSFLTAVNFIVTVLRRRIPDMTLSQAPTFVWATLATSIIIVLATPVVAITLVLVLIEEWALVGMFTPASGSGGLEWAEGNGRPVVGGGNSFVSFFELVWFYSHPYVILLPALGVVGQIFGAFARKQIFGRCLIAVSAMGIAVLAMPVLGHAIYHFSQTTYAAILLTLSGFLVALPFVTGVGPWKTPTWYGLGFVGVLTIGALSGLLFSMLGPNALYTYVEVSHFHYVLVGATMMACLAGIHHWWPKISGCLYPERIAKIASVLVVVGFNLTFLPQFVAGYRGLPRGVVNTVSYSEGELQDLLVLSCGGATILGIGLLLTFLYLLWSLRFSPQPDNNPWRASGLEWQTSSPPPHENFEETPVVTTAPSDQVSS